MGQVSTGWRPMQVARWFFRVGGAAGTIAKSVSAYDMTISDSMYGAAKRCAVLSPQACVNRSGDCQTITLLRGRTSTPFSHMTWAISMHFYPRVWKLCAWVSTQRHLCLSTKARAGACRALSRPPGVRLQRQRTHLLQRALLAG